MGSCLAASFLYALSRSDVSMLSDLDRKLCKALRDHPSKHSNRYDTNARDALLHILFRSLTADRREYLDFLFPQNLPKTPTLREVQGAQEGAEYTVAARGHPCGHIFKSGEATYRCKTCSADDTCCLCSRCFDASDHTGHTFYISISPGNSGCCDCGDLEAWRIPVNCAIHTASSEARQNPSTPKLPDELTHAIKTTIGRAFDYFCDVISCSPEQLRLAKTVDSIKQNERKSRLRSEWYDGGDHADPDPEYALVLWNDEKHTLTEVAHQVTRACKERARFGEVKAEETNDIGRTVVKHSRDLEELLRISKIIEHIKVTVTVRSSRDTFREQMCGTIVEWLVDIAGCSIGDDNNILRQTICEEVLHDWRKGSEASNAEIGRHGIDDHEIDETKQMLQYGRASNFQNQLVVAEMVGQEDEAMNDALDGADEDDEDDDQMDVDFNPTEDSTANSEDDLEVAEATLAGYPPPPPPPRVRREHTELAASHDSDGPANYAGVPRTPYGRSSKVTIGGSPQYWKITPGLHNLRDSTYEDLSREVRLDNMVMYDLRLWKKTRIDLRDLYISTVVNVPAFKRVLGLRFAGLYTRLAQLYLIADREPDHSIINLSLQMLTTPSITEEVVERGNFLTSLMAILYTFLTTRQVGYPKDVSASATLAFDAGSVTNRRLYHFFMDLKYLLQSEYVQKKVREEPQYLDQFLDLIKLPQGICPNVRAVGDHVEYETDAWISASLLTREMNRLCRQFAEAFRWKGSGPLGSEALHSISTAIHKAAYTTIANSVGIERRRFDQSEIRDLTAFHLLQPFDFEAPYAANHRVVDFSVEKGAISFHHALHYTVSWLVECGKSMPSVELQAIFVNAAQNFVLDHASQLPPDYVDDQDSSDNAEDVEGVDNALLAMFDFPLRVCAWLAQMKAGMWVRNGLSLRHQMSQYKGVQLRDVAHHRDIFLLQTALVICDPSRVLASIIDRFGMDEWMRGDYIIRDGYEDTQLLDVAEDFINLLIVLLSDRASLITDEDEPNPSVVAVRKELAHVLCFKPLSFSDLTNRLNEKFSDLEEFQDILDEMTNFRGPEGLNDTGTFELKPEFLEQIDPYSTHYNKNQRDEAESVYRAWMAKKLHKQPADIVFEPKLRSIPSGAFTSLAEFTSKPLFAQIIYYALGYGLRAKHCTPNIPATRVEAFISVVLHLALIATVEDSTVEDDFTEESMESFVRYALRKTATEPVQGKPTIISILQAMSTMDEYASCSSKIKHMIRLFYRKRQRDFNDVTSTLSFPYGRLDTSSPANVDAEAELKKKKQAADRQARVMAQFQQQQQNFLDNQGVLDWGEEDSSDQESDLPDSTETKVWKYPSGVCILCQEETNDSRLYGTFAMMVESNILRETHLSDTDWVGEALSTPFSLDRSADAIRPFGVSGQNHEKVRRLTSKGGELISDRQILGKGFPHGCARKGPVSTGCGHIMHYACFDAYYSATTRRQNHQIARNHPEGLQQKEFVCPLCKALGNAFLPIIWKGKEESYPGPLISSESFDTTLIGLSSLAAKSYQDGVGSTNMQLPTGYQQTFRSYTSKNIVPTLANSFERARASSVTYNPRPPGAFPLNGPGDFYPSSPSVYRESGTEPYSELIVVYKRLRDTIRVNHLAASTYKSLPITLPPTVAEDLTSFHALVKAFGHSIAATEIAQRGIATESGGTLLGTVPQQVLTHLRIVSETAYSYGSVGASARAIAPALTEFTEIASRQLWQLFPASILSSDAHRETVPEPLLDQDVFVFLAETSLVLVPSHHLSIHHILSLCYVAETVKVMLAYASFNARDKLASEAMENHVDPSKDSLAEMATKYASEPEYKRLICNYALPFLRKAVILLHTRYGVDFPSSGLSDLEVPELDRLTRLLRLPAIDDMVRELGFGGPTILRNTVYSWIAHYAHNLKKRPSSHRLRLSHPAILELVGLPKYFDLLMEETNRHRCPTTGKDLTDPSVCLFCGDIFCSQAVCCMQNRKKGGCNLHMEKYGSESRVLPELYDTDRP